LGGVTEGDVVLVGSVAVTPGARVHAMPLATAVAAAAASAAK
jgi:hypothetical protein